jgi:hypothetical protein
VGTLSPNLFAHRIYFGVDRKQAYLERGAKIRGKKVRRSMCEGKEKRKSDVCSSYLKPLLQTQKLCSVEGDGNAIMNDK